jgi:hypothetical protein
VIVRLMGEGQWRIDDGLRERLNELDEKAMEALGRENEAELDGYLAQMAELVRNEGVQLPPEDLSPSDIMIPPPDLSLEETRLLFEGEGLIPDLPGV